MRTPQKNQPQLRARFGEHEPPRPAGPDAGISFGSETEDVRAASPAWTSRQQKYKEVGPSFTLMATGMADTHEQSPGSRAEWVLAVTTTL